MSDAAFERLVARARADERVVGLVLAGGRGKGVWSSFSDWDVYLIVDDDTDPEDVRRDVCPRSARLDVTPMTWAELTTSTRAGGPQEWNRYSFTHLSPIIDRRGGEVAAVCDAMDRRLIADHQRRQVVRGGQMRTRPKSA